MEFRDILLVLHVAGAGTWLGANVIQAVVPTRMARQGSEAVTGWYLVAGGLTRVLYIPAAILILVTGVLLVLGDDNYGFGSIFVTIGFGMIIVGGLLGRFVFDPGSKVAAAAIESGEASRIKAAASRLAAWGTADTVLLLFTMTAMVLRLD